MRVIEFVCWKYDVRHQSVGRRDTANGLGEVLLTSFVLPPVSESVEWNVTQLAVVAVLWTERVVLRAAGLVDALPAGDVLAAGDMHGPGLVAVEVDITQFTVVDAAG